MSQGDCVRVQTAVIELQAAGHRGLLPLQLEELVAVLRSSNPLSVDLSQPDRLLVAAHLESCPSCGAFWKDQQGLDRLLREANFELPPEATSSQVVRLEQRVLDRAIRTFGEQVNQEPLRVPTSPSGRPVLTLKLKDYWSAKREVRVSSKYQTRKLALVAAGTLIVVFVVVYFAFLFPPVSNDDVQGAIGKRDVYRQTNVTEKDVTASSGPGGPSYAGLVELLKSPDFKALVNNSNYQSLTKDGNAFTGLIQNSAFHSLVNNAQAGNQVSGLIGDLNTVFTCGVSQNSAFNELLHNQQFQDAVQASSSFQELIHNSNIANLISNNSNFKDILQNNQFQNAMSHGLFSFIHENAQAMSDLGSMINNSAFHELAGNGNALQELIQNNAFNSLINNQSYSFLSQVQSLQNNSNFNGLIGNSNFIGLISSSQFAGISGNQAFQQLLQDSNFHQVCFSQQQGLIVNNSQFKELINQSYQSLGQNSQFKELINSNQFNSLINNANFVSLLQNNHFQELLADKQLATYASSEQGLAGMVQQSQEIGLLAGSHGGN